MTAEYVVINLAAVREQLEDVILDGTYPDPTGQTGFEDTTSAVLAVLREHGTPAQEQNTNAGEALTWDRRRFVTDWQDDPA